MVRPEELWAGTDLTAVGYPGIACEKPFVEQNFATLMPEMFPNAQPFVAGECCVQPSCKPHPGLLHNMQAHGKLSLRHLS